MVNLLAAQATSPSSFNCSTIINSLIIFPVWSIKCYLAAVRISPCLTISCNVFNRALFSAFSLLKPSSTSATLYSDRLLGSILGTGRNFRKMPAIVAWGNTNLTSKYWKTLQPVLTCHKAFKSNSDFFFLCPQKAVAKSQKKSACFVTKNWMVI